MDRRTTIKWMLAVAAAGPAMSDIVQALGARAGAGAKAGAGGAGAGADAAAGAGASAGPSGADVLAAAQGYGTDPNLTKLYKPGDLWPLTFTPPQRRTAKLLCDLIIPADESSPSASSVGVVEFVDEWISAPYEQQREDRTTVLNGFAWLDREAASRYGTGKLFVTLSHKRQAAICDDICYVAKAKRELVDAAKFFARYRDLTAGGFYTTPHGRKDVRYVGNVPLEHFDGPPLEVLKKVGLA
jgi:hypothetical protein